MMSSRVILASASPRRQQFFQALGIPFSIQPADIEEAPAPGETPISMVERLAAAKALSVGDRLMKEGCGRDERKYSDDNAPASHSIQIIVGADTVVALDGESLGKPQSADEARTMLQRLRGRNHYVHTAVAAVRFAGASPQAACCVVNSTIVTMRAYSDAEIENYVSSGSPMDKAGAYAIQDKRFSPVESLAGCPAGVMGLPAADLLRLLSELGFAFGGVLHQVCRAQTGFRCCCETEPTSPR
ncbi:MAG: Maf family protein [Caldilineaceae bacterium]|nr:Maf family protein [Caldilineaceae bacterium]